MNHSTQISGTSCKVAVGVHLHIEDAYAASDFVEMRLEQLHALTHLVSTVVTTPEIAAADCPRTVAGIVWLECSLLSEIRAAMPMLRPGARATTPEGGDSAANSEPAGDASPPGAVELRQAA